VTLHWLYCGKFCNTFSHIRRDNQCFQPFFDLFVIEFVEAFAERTVENDDYSGFYLMVSRLTFLPVLASSAFRKK